jgi:lipocalin
MKSEDIKNLIEETGCSIMEAKHTLINKRRIEVLRTIAEDMRKDAAHFDGNAKYQGAAIATLADIIASIIE